MQTSIHPAAIVHSGAYLGTGVTVGPYAIIEEQVHIGDGTVIDAGAQIKRYTTLGAKNHVHSMACVGGEPQDLKFGGEESTLVIGDRNRIREFSTIHRGTEGGGGVTRVGSDNLMMAYSHIAHDCVVGDSNVLANAATLAGHVTVGNEVVVGGLSAVHQFVNIGDFAFIGGKTGVAQDVPPFMLAVGERATLRGLNLIGLRRHGLSSEEISALKSAYKLIWRSNQERNEVMQQVETELGNFPQVMKLLEFIRSSKRGTITPERI
ncbi:MAG: acyl-ACP--UDP-N-acetylglucosamine O-acyltransferase [Desulfomicrobium sp.]|nr:acyl-ACP--UDP-N-acetylglucosamine O-acyltransferase [Pseudomonadota bacterium]MBV1714055.1 acyl-ACP--UDP-N-acetylglucosamine O-acyltransferase [Desulfomicrobium sp.]MBU4571592.1 acyl-ACP--UDP-N-acetylglucosamine O-acyltransferase [Pseudomonadota bacterium]MBU4595740.1 acyl-ACP--UDP-N-acetylglucosamine O-acyltransferase [Pseudomonadota bacterium]MBV1721658.1 acyl-ACP--UDP-N-acetylglucosamine O-acyltransferase [Desulfomicrobium sp.]